MITHPSNVDLIEAAFRLDLEDGPWLTEVATALAPWLPPAVATFAFLIGPSPNGGAHLTHIQQREGLGRFSPVASLPGVVPISDPQVVRQAMSGTSARTLSEMPGSLYNQWLPLGQSWGATDALILSATHGNTCLVFFSLFASSLRAAPRIRRLWKNCGLQLAAALRIRSELARMNVLSGPGAKPQTLREILGQICESAVAQGNGAQERDQTLSPQRVWHKLANGEATLVDQLQHGNRQYLVLRMNEQEVRDPRALTAREQEILELAAFGRTDRKIAKELGVSTSTIATHRTRGFEKLGLRSRVLLSQLVNESASS